MKHTPLFLLLFFLSITAFTQVLIIPREGDIPARGEISTMMTAPDPGQLLLRIPGNVAPLAVSESSGRSGAALRTDYIWESIPEARHYTPRQIAAAAMSGSESSKVDNVVVRKVLKSIGGVAFGDIAEASPDLKIKTLSVSYQSASHSVTVELNGTHFTLDDPLWLVLPALRLALDHNWSLVSLTPPNPFIENALNLINRRSLVNKAGRSQTLKQMLEPANYFLQQLETPISLPLLEKLAAALEKERDQLRLHLQSDHSIPGSSLNLFERSLLIPQTYPWELAEEIRKWHLWTSMEEKYEKYFIVAIHPLLQDTAIGYALLFLDFSLVDPALLIFSHLPPLCDPAGKDWAAVFFEKFGRDILPKVPSEKANLSLTKIRKVTDWESYLIYDSNVSVSLNSEGTSFVFNGGGPEILFHGDRSPPIKYSSVKKFIMISATHYR